MKTKNLKVFQSNKYTMSKQRFSLNEKRVMQFIIAKIKPTDTEFRRYEIPIVEIADMANISTKNMYSFAKNLMTDMVTKFIILQDEKNKRLKAFNYFTELEYESGILTVELNRNIHQLFLQLKQNKEAFTAYELAEFMTLSSTHAQRIYEILKQYSKSKQRERTIDLDELREILNATDKYKLYSDFRKRILEYAHTHIQENTNLRYKWEGVTKRGRKVVAIRFYGIYEAGKENPNELQEIALLETYVGENIYNPEFNTYLNILEIEKEKNCIKIKDKFTKAWYSYSNLKEVQESIAQAMSLKLKLQQK